MQQQSIDITIFNSNKQRRLSNLWCELVPPCTPIAFVFVAILVCMFDWRNDPHAMFHSRKVHRIRYLFTHCAIMLFLICLLLNIYKDRWQKAVNECTNRTGIYVTDSHTEIASQFAHFCASTNWFWCIHSRSSIRMTSLKIHWTSCFFRVQLETCWNCIDTNKSHTPSIMVEASATCTNYDGNAIMIYCVEH